MKKQRGFTLVELMVTIVIIAILAMIAYPLYTRYVEKSRRSSAVTALERVASAEEKYYATRNVYASSLTFLGYDTATVAVPSNAQSWYAMSVTSASDNSYTVTAMPQNEQANDACGTYKLTSTGIRSVTGSKSVADCWGSD